MSGKKTAEKTMDNRLPAGLRGRVILGKGNGMEELIKRLERVIATGASDKDGMHPISAEAVLEVVKSQLSTNLASLGTDCISRQQAIDALKSCYCGGEDSCGEPWIYESHAIKAIKQLPPIQPVVRCKDCKHWIPYDWMFSEVWQSKNMTDYPEDEIGCNWCDMAMEANDFCSRGEKREVTT